MHVPEIIEVKNVLDKVKNEGLIKDWELPYENLLTRRDAAHFFVEPNEDESTLKKVWKVLGKFDNFHYHLNEKKTLSEMKYEVKFDKQEEEKSKKEDKKIENNQPEAVEG